MGDPPHLVDGLVWPNSWCLTWPDLIAWITSSWPFWDGVLCTDFTFTPKSVATFPPQSVPTSYPSSPRLLLLHPILQEVDSAKYLGVILNHKPDWSDHIEAIINSANRTMRLLCRNVSHCPRELTDLSYISLICSVREYAAQAWDPYLKKDTSHLDQVQGRAARFTCLD